jgi:GntR family transcriptional regulator / MocR family aminotransferase
VAPTRLLEQVRALRTLVDVQSDRTLDLALAALFEQGEAQRHWRRARRIYRARRDFLVESLRAQLGGTLAFDVPSGGMALWLRVDPAVDVERWAARAAQQGLLFRTGSIFYCDGQPRSHIRLGFAMLNEAERRDAVRRLVKALPATRSRRS